MSLESILTHAREQRDLFGESAVCTFRTWQTNAARDWFVSQRNNFSQKATHVCPRPDKRLAQEVLPLETGR